MSRVPIGLARVPGSDFDPIPPTVKERLGIEHFDQFADAEHNLTPIARIHQLLVTAGDPVVMLEEPLYATTRALARAGMSISDIDLFEVNDAFAPVPLAWLKHTGADPDKLNVNGGAISLGHPLGSSGTKLMTTLVHALGD